MNYYGNEILSQEKLDNGLIKIIVSIDGQSYEYHVVEEELNNSNI